MSGKLVVVGSLNMDLVFQLNQWPERGQTVLGRSYRAVPGGKGANQAVAASRLGASVHMIGCVGQDPFGEVLLNSLRAANVAVESIREASANTGVALITLDPDGEGRIVVIAGANRAVSIHHLEDERELLQDADWLLLQMEIPLEANLAAAELANAVGTPVILTPAPVPEGGIPDDLLQYVSILVPNQIEARQLTGESTPERAAAALRARGVRTVIVTLGAEGALLVDERGARVVPAFPVDVVDSTAAGAAFTGALAVALSGGKSLDDAARYGAAAGALAVTKMGAHPSLPTSEAVEALLAESEGRNPEAYPEELVTTFETYNGQAVTIRPILPADAPRLRVLFDELSPESVYRRFFAHRRQLSESEARSLATVDYHNQLALVATPASEPEHLIGVARFAPSTEREGAVEMAIVIADAFQNVGIGRHLFSLLIDSAHRLGHRFMLVETHSDNHAMLELAERAGYPHELQHDGSLVRVWLDLTTN